MSYKKYRDRQDELQLNWRKKQNNISDKQEKQNRKDHPHPYIIPKKEWSETVYNKFKDNLLEYIKKENIYYHTGTHNLLSSWVFCSNLYFGTRVNNNIKELFRQFLQNKLKIKIDSIKEIHLEFKLPGNLSPKTLLGEPGGTGQTTPDLAIEFNSNGKESLILVECKYTEHNFYYCPARRKNKESYKICLNNKIFTKKCFLNKRGRKYWEYVHISEYGLKEMKYCPAYVGGYQIFRQQALAEGIKKKGNYENVWSCIAYDGRNESIVKRMKRVGIDLIKNEWENLFELKTKFSTWEHQEWINFVRINCSESEKDWLNYILERYGI